MLPIHADIAVLGSGFGGCLTALILERMGVRVIVIDRQAHPRFAIGESSTPMADAILRDLAAAYGLPRLAPLAQFGTWRSTYPDLGVGLKRGFSYFYHEAGAPFTPDASHARELLVAASASDDVSDTHWLRADVDAFFAGEVRRAGIPLYERAEIVARPDDSGWRFEGHTPDGGFQARAPFVIDATGPAGVIPRALRLTETSGALMTKSRALYAHFEGVEPWMPLMTTGGGATIDYPFPADHAALHHVFEGGWMWILRFTDDRVSAGLVLDPDAYPVRPDLTPLEEWQAIVARFPSIHGRFEGATVVAPAGGMVRTGRLQRRVSRAAGPGWAALPFTAGFVDPLHSTGIAHTLSGIERLVRILTPGREDRDRALQAYSEAVLDELDLIDRLVACCYRTSGSFRAYTASVLLYFAAVVTDEQRRAAGRSGGYLCADDPVLRERVDAALERAGSGRRNGPVSDTVSDTMSDTLSEAAAAEYAAAIERWIEPYNTVGLFRSARPNMYHHTASKQ